MHAVELRQLAHSRGRIDSHLPLTKLPHLPDGWTPRLSVCTVTFEFG